VGGQCCMRVWQEDSLAHRPATQGAVRCHWGIVCRALTTIRCEWWDERDAVGGHNMVVPGDTDRTAWHQCLDLNSSSSS